MGTTLPRRRRGRGIGEMVGGEAVERGSRSVLVANEDLVRGGRLWMAAPPLGSIVTPNHAYLIASGRWWCLEIRNGCAP